MPESSELHFLRWFFNECDFGPAHEAVVALYMERFEAEEGVRVPSEYRSDYIH